MNFLHINRDAGEVIYLGYQLKLSKREFMILARIVEKSDEVLDTRKLHAELFSNEKDLILKNITVHICNINRKARGIGGRTLIEYSNSDGYKISDTL